jgi:hypothetical protein
VIDPSTITNSDTTGSTVINSTIADSNATYSNVELSGIYLSDVNNSTIANQTEIDESTVYDSTISSSAVEDEANVTNSDVYNSKIKHGSNVDNTEVTESEIYNSDVAYSNVANSEIEEKSSVTNSNITDSQVDQNSNVINSEVEGYSIIRNSDLNNSYVSEESYVLGTLAESSDIKDSSLFDSNITDSSIDGCWDLDNVTATNSTIDSIRGSIKDAVIVNANITDEIIYSGTVTWNNNTYDADVNGAKNLSDVVNFWPSPDYSYSPASPKEDEEITFTSLSTDKNIGSELNDSLTCSWNFGDGETADACNTTHSFDSKGDYLVSLLVTDSYGYTASVASEITVSKKSTTNDGGSSGGGGGSVLSTSVYSVSLTEEGESKLLKENDKIKFSFDEEYHYVTLMEIKSGSADIKVESTPVVSSINLAETQEFDLNNDSSNDLAVTLNKLFSSNANITVKLISKEKEETNETSETNESQEEIQPEKEETKETKKKETKAEEGWADYAEEQPKENLLDKGISYLKSGSSFIYSKIKFCALYLYNLPYAKYIAAGIAILIVIIIIITLSIRGKNSILPKLGSLVTAFFFEEDRIIENKKKKKTKQQ